jgi:hypothetical protein
MRPSSITPKGLDMPDDTTDLVKLALNTIAAYEETTGYRVLIEQEPDGTVTWTDILPTGDTITTVIQPDDTPRTT